MGYHRNEETTKRAVKDAARFANDRARLEHALRFTLFHLGRIGDSEQLDEIVADVRKADFSSLEKFVCLPDKQTQRIKELEAAYLRLKEENREMRGDIHQMLGSTSS